MADMADDPGAEFMSLMGKAAEQADGEASDAPYGYTKDRATGEMRPKKAPGRGGRRSPSIDELKASQSAPPVADGEDGGEGGEATVQPSPPADRPPDTSRKSLRSSKTGAGKRETPVPPYRAGVITTGINRLYRRAGKIVRAMDEDIGEAVIQSARNTAGDGEPDDSVGAAWEELARTNPRIRKFLMKIIAGGAWGQLVMAHAPIGMAIVMKPAVRNLIVGKQEEGQPPKEPGMMQRLITSYAEPDDDTPDGEGGLPGGMTAGDAGQMADLARKQMAKMGLQVPDEVAGQMEAMAASLMNGGGPPAAPKAYVRNQPRRHRRAG